MAKSKRVRYKSNPPVAPSQVLEQGGYLTTAAAAALMGVSARTFYTLVQEDEIECYAEYGNAHLFRVDEVLKVRKRLYGY